MNLDAATVTDFIKTAEVSAATAFGLPGRLTIYVSARVTAMPRERTA